MTIIEAFLLSNSKRDTVILRREEKRVAVYYNSRWGVLGSASMFQSEGDPLTKEELTAPDWEEVDAATYDQLRP